MYNVIDYGAMATVVAPFEKAQDLRKSLTIPVKNLLTEDIEVLKLFDDVTTTVIKIPRSLVNFEDIPKEFFNNKFENIDVKDTITLRDKQEKLVKDFLTGIKTQTGGILSAKTGTGKSVMGIKIAVELGLKTLIIVPLVSLVKQWESNLLKFTTISKEDIGIIQSDTCDYINKKVCIAMLHTLAKDKYPELYNQFGTVIFDEVHKLGAKTFSQVAKMFNCRYRIGLSATPRRKDNTDPVFFYHIGKILASNENLDITPEVIIISYNHSECAGTYNSWDSKFNLGKYFTRLSLAKERNKLLVDIITGLYEKDRTILVLCDRLDHVKFLYNTLKQQQLENIGVWVGEQKDTNKKVLLATHGSCGLGVDIPELDTIVFASPRSDVEQPVGRILRKVENKKTPLVVDIVDSACLEMRLWGKKREKFYNKIKAKIKFKSV